MALEKKRFIAGAKCPKCKALDSVMLFIEEGVEKLECVMCGYTERQDDDKSTSAINADDSVIGVFKPD